MIRLIQYVFGCVEVELRDISEIQRGASPRPINKYITIDINGINWIKIGDTKVGEKHINSSKEKITEDGAKQSRLVKKGDFILSNSMSFGRPYILNIDGCIHDGWLSISDFQHFVLSDYLYYSLSSSMLQRQMENKASFGGGISNLNADIVKGLTIVLPPLQKQQEIVNKLDKFDEYINSMTSGLRGEIELNHQRYEYFRNKLLTFERKQ